MKKILSGITVSFVLIAGLSFLAFDINPEVILKKALEAYGEGNFKTASSYFRRYLSSSGVLKDYVLYWQADSLKKIERENESLELYEKVPAASPIRLRAVEELLDIHKKRKDWLNSISLARERIALERDVEIEIILQKEAVEMGYLYGKSEAALDNFRKMLERFPASKETLGAIEKYGDFYSFEGDAIPKAKVYLNHRQFEKALECLKNREDRDSLVLDAEAYYGLKDYNRAISIMEKLTAASDDDNLKIRSADMYLATSQKEKGLSIFEKLASEKKGTVSACTSLWKLLNFWKEKDDVEKARIYCRNLREGYRHFAITDRAIWIEGWMNLTGKNYDEAERVWKTYYEIPRKSREKLSALYLIAWMKKAPDNPDNKETKEIYERIASLYPDTYYGLEALKVISFVPSVSEPEVKLGELQENEFERARLLLRFDRIEEVIFELEALKQKRYNDINLRYNLAALYGRAARFNDAMHEAEGLIDFFKESGKWPGFLHVSNRKLLEMSFPKFYKDEVKMRAEEFGLDENLIYAVMREESRFNEKDVSSSGAIGLMQILPSTGKWIMERLNIKYRGEADLFDPAVNIQLGCWYLKYLRDKFNGDILLTIASYNGGPGLIERWITNGGMEDRAIAIEMMPRDETKYYCQKVLFSYNMYGKIYGMN